MKGSAHVVWPMGLRAARWRVERDAADRRGAGARLAEQRFRRVNSCCASRRRRCGRRAGRRGPARSASPGCRAPASRRPRARVSAASTSPVSSSTCPSACGRRTRSAPRRRLLRPRLRRLEFAAADVGEGDLQLGADVLRRHLQLALEHLDAPVRLLGQQEHAVGVVHVRRIRIAGHERLERVCAPAIIRADMK